MTKVDLILAELAHGPRSNAELCEVADEIPSYLSRTMAKLREQGRVQNVAAVRGRGSRAVYALTRSARPA